MCGIAGIIDPDGDYVAAAVLRMGKAMAHRGPDASGESMNQSEECMSELGIEGFNCRSLATR